MRAHRPTLARIEPQRHGYVPLGFALFSGDKRLPDRVSSSASTLHELDTDRASSQCSISAAGTRARTHPWHVASLALNWAHVDGPHFVSGPELDVADATADRALSRCSTDAAGTRARTHPWHVASLALNWAHVDGPHFVSGSELHDADATADGALSRCSINAAGTRALDDADAADQEVWHYMEKLVCQSTGTSCAHARTRARCARTRGTEHRTLFRSERRRLQQSSDCRFSFSSERLRLQRSSVTSSECRVFPAPRSA